MYIPCMLCMGKELTFKYVAQNEQYQNKEIGILIKKNNDNITNSAEINPYRTNVENRVSS